MASVSVLNVKLYGETIGTLTYLESDRALFAFTEEYAADENRPTLSLGFKDDFGQLITQLPVTQTRLLPYFSNLLPEGHLREYLAHQAGVNQKREFFLLWALGRDLSGAITVESADDEAWPIDIENSDAETPAEKRENALRFSLAGIQLKFSAVNDGQANKGLTIPARGVGGSWIVKLPSARFEGVPENEFAMLTIARLVGIDVPEITLIDIDAIRGLPEGIGDLKGQAFAIKRFDRTPDGPVHTEDFAQIFRVYHDDKYRKASYRNVATVLAAETGEAGIEEFIRRLTFCTLTGNADMHLKNWSLIYPDRRNAALSPAYDLVSTIPYIEDEETALKFARSKRFDSYTLDELSYLAGKAGLPEKLVLDTAKQTVARFHEVWQAEKDHLPQYKRVTARIDAHLKTLRI
ncbi:kinase [Methyloceanibacter methanicus]|uniref:Kinase n=1 Tax=Methyloceanibacter methanicus TaxID=1774968 RepID=A0A1E3W0F1_9HYPH|nr:type II toxin-antitoxin system HipA family toxin [Methyloceanibacter methanicus]ODR99277.1 kinase [Methyloceanibacter methanicus]